MATKVAYERKMMAEIEPTCKPEKGESAVSLAVRQLQDFAKFVANPVSGSYHSSSAYYGGCSDKDIKTYGHQCHAHLRSVPMTATVFFNHLPKVGIGHGEEEYYKWVTGPDSPWHSAMELGMSFSPKEFFTEDFWLKNGLVFDRLDIPANLLHNFLCATRVPKEHATVFKRWRNFVNNGINPDMALVGVTVFNSEATEKGRASLQVGRSDWALDVGYYTDSYVSNFLRHTPNEKQFIHSYRASHNYTPSNMIWAKIGEFPVVPTNVSWPLGLRKTYSKDFGVVEGDVYSYDPTRKDSKTEKAWKVNAEEFVEILKLEDKRLRA